MSITSDMDVLSLKNTKTGEVKDFNIVDDEARDLISELETNTDSKLAEKADQSSLNLLQKQVNNIVGHNNNTNGNTELIDIRTGADGTVYDTAGEAVRGQIDALEKDKICLVFDRTPGKALSPFNTWITFSDYPSYTYSYPVKLTPGTTFIVDTTNMSGFNESLAICAFFKSKEDIESQIPFGSVSYTKIGTYKITVPEDYPWVVFNKPVNSVGVPFSGSLKVFLGNNYIVLNISEMKENISEMKENISEMKENQEFVSYSPEFKENAPGVFISANGNWSTVDSEKFPNFTYSTPICLQPGTTFIVDTTKDVVVNPYIACCSFFKNPNDITNQTPYGTIPYVEKEKLKITVPEDYPWVVFNNKVTGGGSKISDLQILISYDVLLTAKTINNSKEELNGTINNIKISLSDQISKIEDSLNTYVNNTAQLKLPKEYHLVVGDTFELFWKGVIQAVDPYQFNIRVKCSVGNCYKRKFEFTPTKEESYSLTVVLEDNSGKILDSQNTTLICKSPVNSVSSSKTVLCIGDSLLVNGQWAYESYRRLAESGGNPSGLGLNNVHYIGTCKKENAGFEGYGGWTFNSYNTENKLSGFVWVSCSHNKTDADQHSIYTDSTGSTWKLETIQSSRLKMIRTSGSGNLSNSGVLTYVSGGINTENITFSNSEIASGNPFWNESTQKVDFKEYVNKQNVSNIDYCYILLGWNSTETVLDIYKTQVTTFLNSLIKDFPDCKIGLLGLQVPSLDGFGVNYGCNWNYYDKLKKVFEFNDLYTEISNEYPNVHFVNISGQFDTEYNMPVGTRTVNTRNSKTETYQTNGVHPATEGYNQIADAVFRDLNYWIQS